MSDEEEVAQPKFPPALIAKYKKAPYKALMLRMKELAETAAEHDRICKDAKAELLMIQTYIVPERFAEEDIKNIKIDGIGRLALTSEMHCNVLAARKGDFFEWMKKNGYDHMYKPTLNASSLKSLIKDLGNSEDDDQQKLYAEIQDYVTVHPFMRATITKA